MVRTDAFRVEGAVIEVISPAKYWVKLPNGHRLVAHLPARYVTRFRPLAPGDIVRLELSPYDLSAGRIIVPNNETNEA
jgi:translation initiation factor IF-1